MSSGRGAVQNASALNRRDKRTLVHGLATILPLNVYPTITRRRRIACPHDSIMYVIGSREIGMFGHEWLCLFRIGFLSKR